jgi:hypothetical protein
VYIDLYIFANDIEVFFYFKLWYVHVCCMLVRLSDAACKHKNGKRR